MKKTIVAALFASFSALTANAQFEIGKVYVSGALSGLDMNYSGSNKFKFDLDAKAGYMFEDDFMLLGQASYSHCGKEGVDDALSAGLGVRYYIEQNGIFLGAGCKYVHSRHYNDFMPGIEVGYAFFLSRTVTVEPSIYYDQSFKSHSDFSTIGARIGIGVYL